MVDFEGNKAGNNTCNTIQGTDGNQFHPMLKQEETLWIFNTAPCRSIFLAFSEEVDVEGELLSTSPLKTFSTDYICRNWGSAVHCTSR